MKGVRASWTAGCGLTSNSRRRSPTPGALGPATSREGRERGRRGRNANFQNPLPQFADVPVLCSDMFQQSNVLSVSLLQFFDDVWTFSLCNRDRYVVLWYRKRWSFRSCSSSLAVDISFVPQKLIPIVQPAQQIMEILQLLLFLVVDVRVVRVVHLRPFVLGSHLFGVRPWSTGLWTFLEITSRYAVFSASWFNSGYMSSSSSSCFLLVAMHLALCSLACRPFVADNSGSTRVVLLVTKHLALYSLFPSSGPRCATSWPVWTRRTVRRCIPCSWLSLVQFMSPEEYMIWIFLMMTSGNVSYSSYACFDSGYKFMRQTTVAGFLLVTFHLAQCSLPRGQAHEAWPRRIAMSLAAACHGWFCWWPCISRCAR